MEWTLSESGLWTPYDKPVENEYIQKLEKVKCSQCGKESPFDSGSVHMLLFRDPDWTCSRWTCRHGPFLNCKECGDQDRCPECGREEEYT